jgi:hypothetical protein
MVIPTSYVKLENQLMFLGSSCNLITMSCQSSKSTIEARKERQSQYWKLNRDRLMVRRNQRREDAGELEKIRNSERESSRRKYKRLQTEVFVCGCCSVEISFLSKFKHVKSKKHLANTQKSVTSDQSVTGCPVVTVQ